MATMVQLERQALCFQIGLIATIVLSTLVNDATGKAGRYYEEPFQLADRPGARRPLMWRTHLVCRFPRAYIAK
jgi:hypothetical protein